MANANDVPKPVVETREQKIARIRALYAKVGERMHRSKLELEGCDPNKSYYFGNVHPQEMTVYNTLGFVVDKDAKVKGALPRKEDGSLVIGDLILLSIPRDEYEAMQALNQLKSEESMDAAVEKLVSEAERMNVPTFEAKGR